MAKGETISIELLHQLLIYDPNDGSLVWRERPLKFFKKDCDRRTWNTLYSGKHALACVDPSGYCKGITLGWRLYSHRVIWAMVYGEWPEYIDHINQNRADNRLSNLRSVSNQENGRNCAINKNNFSGHMGVHRHPNGKWRAVIMVNYKNVSLGYFHSKDMAIAARKAAEIKYNFHPNHGRVAA